MLIRTPLRVLLARQPRLLLGCLFFGVGIAFLVLADLGLPPWDVLHQGLDEKLPLSYGVVTIVVSAVVLLVVIALREPIGWGTVINVVVIGFVIDGVFAVVDTPGSLGLRVLLMLAGTVLIAIGSGLYLGTRLGPGPRDGLMTALHRRGVAIWLGRSVIEGTVFVVGIVLGGTIGIGTVWYLVSIGPLVQLAMRRLALGPDRP
ncbi:MAG: hypothetical protein R3C15_13480 [Thermoleophilia bacterium]